MLCQLFRALGVSGLLLPALALHILEASKQGPRNGRPVVARTRPSQLLDVLAVSLVPRLFRAPDTASHACWYRT